MTVSFKGTVVFFEIYKICGLSVASSDSFIWQALDNVQWTISLLIEEIPPRLESRQKLAEQKAGSCWSTDRLMHLLARN